MLTSRIYSVVVLSLLVLSMISLASAQCSAAQTAQNEGFEPCCYTDTVGLYTIGYGFNLEQPGAAQIIADYTGMNIDDIMNDCDQGTQAHCLSQDQAFAIFNGVSYPTAQNCADAYAPNLPPTVRAAVTDVAFAGCGTLNKFVNMQAALSQQEWQSAADELYNSKWCGQVKGRCDRDYDCIASGTLSAEFVVNATLGAVKAGRVLIAPNPGAYAGQVVADQSGRYRGECVSYVKVATGSTVPTSAWSPGQLVMGSTNIARGTAIANFNNGKYYTHAAIYMGQNADGIQVWDQWIGQPVHQRTIRWNGDKPSNKGSIFYVINVN